MSEEQPVVLHMNKNMIKVPVAKVWEGDFSKSGHLLDHVLVVQRRIESSIRNSLEGLKCRVMIPGGEVVIPIDVDVILSIEDTTDLMKLMDKPPKPLKITYGKAYHKLLDSAWFDRSGVSSDNKNVSRLMVEGLISAGRLTVLGQDVFDQLSAKAIDNIPEIFRWLLQIELTHLCGDIIRRTLQQAKFAESTAESGNQWAILSKGRAFIMKHVVAYIQELKQVSLTAVAVSYLPMKELPPYLTHGEEMVRQAARLRAVAVSPQGG